MKDLVTSNTIVEMVVEYEPCIKNAANHWHREKMASDKHYAARYISPGMTTQASIRRPGHLRWWSTMFRRQFEDWLWDQSALLVRDHDEFYLKFMDPQMASLFVLRWGGNLEIDN